MAFPQHIVTVEGLISDENGQVLLTRHPQRGWGVPGGQVEWGEDLIAALQREVEEETGVAVCVGQLVGVYSNIRQERIEIPPKVLFAFLGERVSGGPRACDESLEVGWFSREEVLGMISSQLFHDRTRDMLGFSGRVVYRAYSKDPYTIYKEAVL